MRTLNLAGPSGLGVRPRLGDAAQENAALTLVVSSKALGGVSGWGFQLANWNSSVGMVASRAALEVSNLDRNVIGRLGSEEAEASALDLRDRWQALKDKADRALADPPSYFTQLSAKWDQFVSDFKAGATEAWQGYLQTSVELAGPVLESYWNSVSKVQFLQADLAKARESGKFSQEELNRQAAQIAAAQSRLETIRTLYRKMSLGASLDDVAESKFGPHELGAIQVPVAVVVGVVAVAALVASLALFMGKVDGLLERFGTAFDRLNNDPEFRRMVIGISVVGLALIGLVFISKD